MVSKCIASSSNSATPLRALAAATEIMGTAESTFGQESELSTALGGVEKKVMPRVDETPE